MKNSFWRLLTTGGQGALQDPGDKPRSPNVSLLKSAAYPLPEIFLVLGEAV